MAFTHECPLLPDRVDPLGAPFKFHSAGDGVTGPTARYKVFIFVAAARTAWKNVVN